MTACSMKVLISLLVISLLIFSCKKESVSEIEERCGTVFGQPLWAKTFKADSLYDFTNISSVLFGRTTPSYVTWDTSYTTQVQIRFFPDGAGRLNGNVPFQYSINLTNSYPEVLISNIQDLSSLYPFSYSFLNNGTIKMTIEFYTKEGCRAYFTNGVPFPYTQVYESSFLYIKK